MSALQASGVLVTAAVVVPPASPPASSPAEQVKSAGLEGWKVAIIAACFVMLVAGGGFVYYKRRCGSHAASSAIWSPQTPDGTPPKLYQSDEESADEGYYLGCVQRR